MQKTYSYSGKRLWRSIKAISPVIAVLLMIVIAVAASLVAYAWVMGYLSFTTSKVGNAVQVQGIATDNDKLVLYVQNVGQNTVEFNPENSIYVNDRLINILSIDKNPLEQGKTATIMTDYPITEETASEPLKIKVVTSDGISFESINSKGVSYTDTMGPLIESVTVDPNQGPVGTDFEISATVTDLSGVQNVVAHIQKPDETDAETVPLTGTGPYTGTWESATFGGGTYLIDIVATDSLGNSFESENTATIGVTTTTTLLSDGFEEKWASTRWDRQTDQKHDGSYSINSDSGNQGYLDSFSINAQGAASISISFWYRHTNIADSDFEIYLYNSAGGWTRIARLGDDGGNNNWYHYTYSTSSSSYRHSQFKLRFRTQNLGSGENVWIDDAQVTVTGGPGTIFADNFEHADPAWNQNWQSTNWDPSSTAHSGSIVSAWSSNGNEGSFTSVNLDASQAESITIDFWLMLDDTETADLTLRLYDGSSYDDIATLGTFGTHDNWLHYSHTTTDAQYFKSNFKIQFFTNISSGENVWIDDVQITIETIPP